MTRSEIRDSLYPKCPVRNVLNRVGDKWSMLVLFTYELTSRGKSLLPLIDNLLSWASTNMDGIMQSRETFFLK